MTELGKRPPGGLTQLGGSEPKRPAMQTTVTSMFSQLDQVGLRPCPGALFPVLRGSVYCVGAHACRGGLGLGLVETLIAPAERCAANTAMDGSATPKGRCDRPNGSEHDVGR